MIQDLKGGGSKTEINRDMKRKGSDKHPRLQGTSMRYGAGSLPGGRAPWGGPSPLSSPLARVARHSRDTTENG